MSLYGRFFASSYDRICAPAEQAGLAARRHHLLAQASGRVLEIGAGTGANLEHYPAAITDLTLTEPEEPMAARLDRRCAELGRPARIVRAGAERLPFDDDSFDTVVCTLVLCTVPEPSRALAEIARVLRPQGTLLFLEHVRSADPGLARWQNRLNRFQRVVGRGCNCNRPTPSLIEAAGFQIDSIEKGELPKVYPILRPMVTGRAVTEA
jgi:ubiquinone/menaquinone biosynthesis C-methylase UbiE